MVKSSATEPFPPSTSPGPRGRSTAPVASPIRRLILNTARELIAERGFTAMQMAEVARCAGLATGSLYRHFRSKDDLTAHVFRELASREANVMRRMATGDGDVETRFTLCIRSFCERAVKGRRLARALLLDPLEDSLIAERAALRRLQAQVLCDLLSEARANGTITCADPEVAAACLTGALTAALLELGAEASCADGVGDARLDSIVEFCRLGAGFGQSRRWPLAASWPEAFGEGLGTTLPAAGVKVEPLHAAPQRPEGRYQANDEDEGNRLAEIPDELI